VSDGDPVPFPKKGAETPSPIFGPFLLCQTVRCIKMPLGMDVGLRPGDFVLDGDPAHLPILMVEVRISKLDRKCGALPVAANFVALEQQINLVKTRSEAV